jgi:hypothetical protein
MCVCHVFFFELVPWTVKKCTFSLVLVFHASSFFAVLTAISVVMSICVDKEVVSDAAGGEVSRGISGV